MNTTDSYILYHRARRERALAIGRLISRLPSAVSAAALGIASRLQHRVTAAPHDARHQS
jgi:hypothetical protein